MNQEQKLEKAVAYAESLADSIKSFRPFDADFQPLDETSKKTFFKPTRESGWPVLKQALFVMNKDSRVMMFYRHPLEIDPDPKKPKKALDTYGLTSHNSIVVYGDGGIPFSELAGKRIQGWPKNVHIISAGMGCAVVAGGYRYFFEVGCAVVPNDVLLFIGSTKVAFVDLQSAVEIMNSHGLEYKEMEINIARTLCRKK